MPADLVALSSALEKLEALFPYTYGQFLVEDSRTFDYCVVAERIPGGGEGYAIAHRTGVIGQVFRTRRAIAVPDTRRHPLYDPYDTSVDWELAVPLFRGGAFAGVLNLEGGGTLPGNHWDDVARVLAACSLTAMPPDAEAGVLVQTRRAFFADEHELIDAARRLAGEGRSVLMVGPFPEFAWAGDAHAPLAECIHGIAANIDVLQSNGDGLGTLGWSLVEGRYEFVLVQEGAP